MALAGRTILVLSPVEPTCHGSPAPKNAKREASLIPHCSGKAAPGHVLWEKGESRDSSGETRCTTCITSVLEPFQALPEMDIHGMTCE